MSSDTGVPAALAAWEVTYQIRSVMEGGSDGSLVAEDTVVVSAPDQDAAALAAVRWVHENNLGGDAAIGLIVKVAAVDQAELEDPAEALGD